MTPQAQRIAIAELAGWKKNAGSNRLGIWSSPNGQNWDNCPDFLNSLDLVIAAARYCAERVMNADQWEEFGRLLEHAHPTAVLANSRYVGGIDHNDLATLLTGLTADQYAECLLKATGKWTE